ncbi:T9SS type A sorting domain-containing protein [bacterium]|nr:T9SS type A sorting domain-containing protein [bacterium]
MKKIVLINLIILIAIASLSFSSSEKERIAQLGWNHDNKVSLTYEYITIAVNNTDGRFTIGTADSRKLLFGFPSEGSTSHTYVRFDSLSYMFGSSYGTMVTAPYIEGNSISCTWRSADIDVTQVLTVTRGASTGNFDTVWIRYIITNNSGSTKNVGVLLEMDTQINYNDSAPISTSFGYAGVEQDFSYPNIPQSWQAFEQSPTQPESLLVGQGTLVGGGAVAPDRFCLGQWGTYYSVTWDYTSTGGTFGDSAVLLWWYPVAISTGHSNEVSTFYGLGAGSVSLGELAINLTAPITLTVLPNGEYSPNPFEVVVLITNTITVDITDVTVTINLPPGLHLVSGESATQSLTPGDLTPGQTGSASWNVEVDPQATETELTYTIEVNSTEYTNSSERTIVVPATSGATSGILDVELAIMEIETSNFPVIKALCKVVDPETNPFISIPGLDESNFEVFENRAAVSPFDVLYNGVDAATKDDFDSLIGSFDIAVVNDVSNYMTEYSEVKDNLLNIIPMIAESTDIDLAVSLISFTDHIEELYDFSTSYDELLGWTETAFEYRSNSPSTTNGLEAIYRTFGFSWREGSARLLFLITGAPFATGGAYTTMDAVNQLRDLNVRVVVLGIDNADMHMIADSTEGNWAPIGLLSQIVDSMGVVLGEGSIGQYEITYTTPDPTPDGAWRSLEIGVTVQDTLTDNDESGYYSPSNSGLYFDPETTYTRDGYSFNIDVRAKVIVNLYDVHFIVHYDPAKLVYNSMETGEFLAREANTPLQVVTSASGYVDISLTRNGSSAGVTGSGILAALNFTAIATDPTSEVYFSDVVLRDPDYVDTPTEVDTFGYIRYLSGSGSGTPGDTTDCIICDFDCDGDIDMRDFSLLGKYWQPDNDSRGDVGPGTGAAPTITPNPDGSVNYEDLFIFGRMWNWYHATVLGYPKTGYVEGILMLTQSQNHINLVAESLPLTAMGHFIISYDPARTRISSITLSDLPMGFTSNENGVIDISAIKLGTDSENAQVSGNATFAVINYTGANTFQIAEVDLRDANGEAVKVTTSSNAIIPSFSLSEIIPNPFNPTTNFTVTIPAEGNLTVEVYDIAGHKINTIVNEDFTVGTHSLSWDGSEHSSGIYYIKAVYDNNISVRKAILIK